MHSYHIEKRGKPLEKASQALILIHGRGGTASDILELADEFSENAFYVVAPQATNNTWYPYSFLADEKQNEPWLSSAIEVVKRLIDDTSKYIPKDKIYLMGFSQGACVTLETAARYAEEYGGVVAFTGGVIGSVVDESKYRGNFGGAKVFIGLSENDPHVPLVRAEESKKLFEKLGAKVTLKVYPGSSHTINEDEINWVQHNLMR